MTRGLILAKSVKKRKADGTCRKMKLVIYMHVDTTFGNGFQNKVIANGHIHNHKLPRY